MGAFNDSLGRAQTITGQDVEKLIAGFDKTDRRIPLVFGHPKINAPAYGWVEALRRIGDVLQAKFRQLHDDVKKLVRNGNYKDVSIALAPDKSRIVHGGLLGAVQPAILGLREVEFSDQNSAIVIEFNQHSAEDLQQMRQSLNTEWTELRKLQQEMNAKKREERITRLRDTVNQGKVTPAEMSMFTAFAEALEDANTVIQFSGDSTPVHTVDALADILEKYPYKGIDLDFSLLARKPSDWAAQQYTEAIADTNPAYLI